MKKLLLFFGVILVFSECQKSVRKTIPAKTEFSKAGELHNRYLNVQLNKMRDANGYLSISELFQSLYDVRLNIKKMSIHPTVHISEMAWYSQNVDFTIKKAQLKNSNTALDFEDQNLMERIESVLNDSYYDLPLLHDRLLSLQEELISSASSEVWGAKCRDVISIAYYSALYWQEFYETTNSASGKQSQILLALPDIVTMADLNGYILGYNKVMSDIEPFCNADPVCRQNTINWATCSGIFNGSVYSGTVGTPNFPSAPIPVSSNFCTE